MSWTGSPAVSTLLKVLKMCHEKCDEGELFFLEYYRHPRFEAQRKETTRLDVSCDGLSAWLGIPLTEVAVFW